MATKKKAKQVSRGKTAQAPSAKKKAASKKTTVKKKVAAKSSKAAAPTGLTAKRQQALQLMHIPELKELLRNNDQLVGGTKKVLVDRILYSIEHGGTPRCPECGIGRLRQDSSGNYHCPGGYDDDEYVDCGYYARENDIKRPDWQFGATGVV